MRKRVLGDIINGNPVFVGAPSTSVQGSGYETFYSKHAGRAKAVYVGANDGMLHAFDATSGLEMFAYVPNALIPGLNRLTSPNTGISHIWMAR
ncbi:PilC/PilY family type IV pilus protein [Noviherbaspirillum saxi]|uniref:PilC/PilY family type IV pilus protein n=1 Tax=Noviherbaspirillum saxi TaxID=2320863 RepID=UPI003B75B5DA